jgi:hypothetical protein
MAKKTNKSTKKGKKLRGKSLGSIKPLKTPSPAGPVPIPYPN